MKTMIQRTCDYLGVRHTPLLVLLPQNAQRIDKSDDSTLLVVQLPYDQYDEAKAWKESFKRAWNETRGLILAAQPVVFSSSYKFQEAVWRQTGHHAPLLSEQAPKFRIPEAVLSKKGAVGVGEGEVTIFCPTKDDLMTIAALGLRFRGSELLAQAFYAKHGIARNIEEIAGIGRG